MALIALRPRRHMLPSLGEPHIVEEHLDGRLEALAAKDRARPGRQVKITTPKRRKLRGDPWSLLRLHDADRFGVYHPTFRGLQIEDEAGFEEWLEREAARLAEQAEGGDIEG